MLAPSHYQPDGLSPCVRAHYEAVGTALRTLLAPPDEATVSWTWTDPTDVVASISLPDGTLGIRLRSPARSDGWVVGDTSLHIQRHTDGVDALVVPALRALLTQLGGRVAAKTLNDSQVRHALAAFAPWDLVHDRMLRTIEQTSRGRTGILRLGFGCSQDCAFCWQGRSWPSPPDPLYAVWIDEMAAQGVTALTITGGEPTLHADLPGLVAQASARGMSILLQTNAIRLRRAPYAAALRAAGAKALLVSLHAADAGISDAMTRAPGTHSRTLEGIHGALAAGFKVALNCVVERANTEDLPNLSRLILDRFVANHPDNPPVMVNFSQPADYFERAEEMARIAPLAQVRPHLIEATRILQDAGMLVVTTGQCGFPVCVFHGAMELAQISPVSFRDPWHLGSRGHSHNPCGGCAAREVCVGRRSTYRERFGDDGLIALTAEELALARRAAAPEMPIQI